jgi:hypothetical protein
MSRMFTYYGPTDIGSAFPSKNEVGVFIEYMIGRVNEMALENKGDDFIPPIVYSIKGKVFNVDYNFLINCLDDFHDNVGIKEDFFLSETPSPSVLKNGHYFVTCLLDDYYDVVRIRQRSLDISRVKSVRVVEIKDKFYNVLAIKNGDNVKRFSAVPFSASEVKKIVSDSAYNLLDTISNKGCFEQVVFGIFQYSEWVRTNSREPEYVTE